MIDIQPYLNELTEKYKEHYSEYKNNMSFSFRVIPGSVWFKVIRYYFNGQRFVHCFVNKKTGDIYKAASWRRPAKGIRGNVKDDVKPLMDYEFYKDYKL